MVWREIDPVGIHQIGRQRRNRCKEGSSSKPNYGLGSNLRQAERSTPMIDANVLRATGTIMVAFVGLATVLVGVGVGVVSHSGDDVVLTIEFVEAPATGSHVP